MGVMKPPPVTWNTHLDTEARAHAWRYAAGKNTDGSDKLRNAHDQARNRITHMENVRLALLKTEDVLTTEDTKTLEKQDKMLLSAMRRKSDLIAQIAVIREKSVRERTYDEHVIIKNADKRVETVRAHNQTPARKEAARMWAIIPENKDKRMVYRLLPHNVAKQKSRDIERDSNHTKARMDKAWQFIEEHGVDVGKPTLSDEMAFQFVLKLIDDVDSVVGKAIFHALDGMTLRTAFWEGASSSAMYALMSRGDATLGGGKAESLRFLLRNNQNIPVLTRTDNNQNFKYIDEDRQFQDLQLIYIPIRATDNYSDISVLESAFQILFDFLPVGSKRLWKISGVGRSTLPLRKSDKLYITRTGDKKLRFMFGITILKNVKIVESTTDVNGKQTVLSITGGLGTKCNVNQGLRRAPITSDSQMAALVKAQAALPPNFMDRIDSKRKANVLDKGPV
ncbi:hypothetical protein T484DRAFT_1758088 [Baffinella frigidus]|nr:hypothetical protein T484DRAFT_1758088 [Cryptophyta sp. CCMP2293]